MNANPQFFGTTTSESDLIRYATSLVPSLKSRTAEVDQLGRLPQATIDELSDGGLFALTTPRRYGGQQTSVRTFLEVVSELGRGDASTAWVAALLNVTTWAAAALFDEKTADDVFGGAKPARVAGVLSPRKAIVKRVDGGYLIEEGMWGFNSGIYHANWDMLGIPLVDASGKVVDQGIALIPVSDLRILNDWNVMALRGTGSSSVAVSNLFVPDSRVASMSAAIEGKYGASHLADEPLYRVACMPMLSIILTFPALGIASAALDTFLELLPRRGIQYTWYTRQAEAAVTHLQVGEASAKLDAARAIIERHADAMDRYAASGEYMPYMERAKVRRDVGLAEKLVWEGVDSLATASGGSLASLGNPFARVWHDARVASLHGIVVPATNFEMYGRLACGQPADTPLI
ncbi:acyl-CoA dehydrogenase family protein [Paraburkholderia terrae]|uniref:acyl-CoA dehydrogenase family protein n=1 Tax=Paraburkholderia terrae TaxID=311230 RepID=UPI001EE2AD86|nr:acyl-CoA dehydrogenase family protein [Paraburkholderia terrae]GJH01107.1 acyl-CoA dehydrogenase family protein [Paraburkholderia terrae]